MILLFDLDGFDSRWVVIGMIVWFLFLSFPTVIALFVLLESRKNKKYKRALIINSCLWFIQVYIISAFYPEALSIITLILIVQYMWYKKDLELHQSSSEKNLPIDDQ